LKLYDNIIQLQLKQGIVERVLEPGSGASIGNHYLPHHPIVTPSNSTTKVRIVYDASAKAGRNVKCLNDYLHRGSITLPDLCGVLSRL